jgi:hypothetical protein
MLADAEFDAAILGAVPAGVEAALKDAGLHRADPVRAMAALMRAKALAPSHPAVLIAFYRHYFYSHQPVLARDIARQALVIAAKALGLPAMWHDVLRDKTLRQPMNGAKNDPRQRFYLFLLKGYAYLSLRMGDDSEARDALALLRVLDPEDCVGGALIEGVRLRSQKRNQVVEEDDEVPYVQATGASAWALLPQEA